MTTQPDEIDTRNIFTYRGHNYRSQVLSVFKEFFKWGYKLPIRYWTNVTWFGHGDKCCDYWTPIEDPKAHRALILDDNLALEGKNEK